MCLMLPSRADTQSSCRFCYMHRMWSFIQMFMRGASALLPWRVSWAATWGKVYEGMVRMMGCTYTKKLFMRFEKFSKWANTTFFQPSPICTRAHVLLRAIVCVIFVRHWSRSLWFETHIGALYTYTSLRIIGSSFKYSTTSVSCRW